MSIEDSVQPKSSMQLKTPLLVLSPIDNAVPRMYMIKILFFPMTKADKVEIFNTLRLGLHRILEAIPSIKGTVVTLPTAAQEGSQAISAPFRTLDEFIDAQYLTTQPTIDYNDLRARSFPLPEMQLKTFIPCIIPFMDLPSLDQPHPVSLVQVTFMKGGFAVAIAMAHAFVDGQGGWSIIELWAALCRGESDYLVPRLQPAFLELIRCLPQASPPEIPLLVVRPEQVSSNIPLRRELFFIPRSNAQALKAFVAPAQDQDQSTLQTEPATWISSFDAVAALLWGSIIDVRRTLNKLDTQARTSTFAVPVSFRHWFRDPNSSPYLGNLVLIPSIHANEVDAVTTQRPHLRATAALIRRSLMSFSAKDVINAVTLLQDASNISVMIPHFLTCPNHAGLTTVAKEPTYDLSWGPIVGQCERSRTHVDGPSWSNGWCMLFPEVKRGGEREEGLEIMVNLFDDEMEGLKRNVCWTQFAKWRG